MQHMLIIFDFIAKKHIQGSIWHYTRWCNFYFRVQSLWSPISSADWYNSLFFHEVAIRGDPNQISKKRRRRDILETVSDAWDSVTTWVDTTVDDLKRAVSDTISDIRESFFSSRCQGWHAREMADPPDFSDVPISPCTLDQAINDPNFEADKHCNMGSGCGSHPGAFHCVRSAEPR